MTNLFNVKHFLATKIRLCENFTSEIFTGENIPIYGNVVITWVQRTCAWRTEVQRHWHLRAEVNKCHASEVHIILITKKGYIPKALLSRYHDYSFALFDSECANTIVAQLDRLDHGRTVATFCHFPSKAFTSWTYCHSFNLEEGN